MSEYIQQGSSQESTDPQIWRFRWFLVYLYAIALILFMPASVIIAVLTRNPLPGLIPAPLLLSMRPMIRWAFSHSPDKK
ncbi:MAG TPA: hypothetical protein VEP90_10515 [Methylomirabilota bacterium]|nr:hypothetical protein [Methylomirabilota bacterium]